MSSKLSRFGTFYVPEGLPGVQAQVFNPGRHPMKRFALKGREILLWLFDQVVFNGERVEASCVK
jgi:hypothetical protein